MSLIIVLSTGLVSNGRQAITTTNNDTDHWRIYASSDLHVLPQAGQVLQT